MSSKAIRSTFLVALPIFNFNVAYTVPTQISLHAMVRWLERETYMDKSAIQVLICQMILQSLLDFQPPEL